MLKTTSIASVIGVYELTNVATVFGSPTFSIFELLLLSTIYYLLLTTIWGYIQSWLERSLDVTRTPKVEVSPKQSWAARVVGFGGPRPVAH
jgi:polar amino acid transport system permease protein